MTSTKRIATQTVTVADVLCRAPGGSRSEEEDSSGWTLVIPYRGVFVWEVENHRIVAEPNTLLLFRPGQPHRISHPVDGGDACVALRLGEDWIDSLRPRDVRTPLYWILDGPSQTAVQTAAHDFNDADDDLHTEETLATIIGAINRAAERRDAIHERIIDAVRERIACNPGAHLTLKVLAAGSGLSAFELARQFRALTGSSIHQYRLRVRLLTALGCLRDGASDLTRLALDLGFSSHAHFTSAFTATFGKPPSAARRRAASRRTAIRRQAAGIAAETSADDRSSCRQRSATHNV